MQIRAVKSVIWVRDMTRAVAFYRDVLGLEARFVDAHWSELGWRDATVALHGGGDGTGRTTGLSIQVDDLERAVVAVEKGGGRIVRPPEDRPGEPIRLADVADPEGNVFQLTEALG
jgi:predicted enzyme related to lactoylglutathione lyase